MDRKLDINGGFTRVPHAVLNGILVASLKKREIKVLLLVCRLSYGCQQPWAKLLLKELKSIQISESHASEVMKELIRQGYLIRNPFCSDEYRVNAEMLAEESWVMEYHGSVIITSLISKNLFRTSQNNTENTPILGSKSTPKKEVYTSQNGMQLSHDTATAIDSDSKYRGIDRKITLGISTKEGDSTVPLDPRTFEVKTESDEKALKTWEAIEENNFSSFGYYYYAIVRRKAPHYVVDDLVFEIQNSPHLTNPGAYFVTKMEEFLENWEEDEEDELL